MEICTGYIDNERNPIHLGDYMESPDEEYFGQIIKYNNKFVLSYPSPSFIFDDIQDVADKYHIISENYANFLQNYL